MDEAARVLARLMRIEELRKASRRISRGTANIEQVGEGAASELLAELRALVPEAEAWVRAEGDARARTAVSKLRGEAEGMD
jgi:hypothetical protein